MFNFNEDDDPARQPDPASQQFTTGPTPVTIAEDDWREFRFGFRATSISVRSDAPIVVALARPFDQPDRHITLTTEELPFSIGGDTPVNTDAVWVKPAPFAETNPEVQIIAL